jgi:cytochrome c553
LRLDSYDHATALLPSGKRAIVPGNARKSELIRRISSSDHQEIMPPIEMNKTLSEREVALLSKWIEQGAKWEPYWAFMPVEDPPVPSVQLMDFVNNDIDNFILNKLSYNNLNPSTKSDKSILLRRLSYILTGLPPSIDELNQFISDSSPQAYAKMVDYYLASPRFGEHWARHWMDLVRYADTRGHEFDYGIIEAWRYRDYLIRAFNEDLSYQQLVKEHLAGDLVDQPRSNQFGGNESIIGTAFFCLTEGKHSPVDIRADEAERIDNIIDVTTKTFQGLTVGCAKCHDHKFDPIPTTDYYALYGMIESTRFALTPLSLGEEKLQLLDSVKTDMNAIKSLLAEQELFRSNKTIEQVRFALPKEATVIGDFREGDLQDWDNQGIAFKNALGMPHLSGNQVEG